MKYDRLTRLLHLLVAAGITSQAITSAIMIPPKPNVIPNEWYGIHESTGMGLLAVLVVYWAWVIVRTIAYGQAMRLFPWFSVRRLGELREDIVETVRGIARFTLPYGDEPQPLASAIQGLGLLLGLAMAGTGTFIALTAPGSSLWPYFFPVLETHEMLGAFVWLYLMVHPLLGILHQIAGHGSITRMFGIGKRV